MLDSLGGKFSQGDSLMTEGSSLLQKQNPVNRKLPESAKQPKVAHSSVKSSLPKQDISSKTVCSPISPGVPESTSSVGLHKNPTFTQFSTSCKIPSSPCSSDCKLKKLSNRTPCIYHFSSTLDTAHHKMALSSHQRPAVMPSITINVSSGTSFTKHRNLEPQDITTTESLSYLRLTEAACGLFGVRKFQAEVAQKSHVKQKPQDYKNVTGSHTAEDSLTDIIEEVIQKYCYGAAQDHSGCTDEESSINPPVNCTSSQSSSICFDWDKLVQRENCLCKNETELEHLREVSVNFKDKQYEPQLHSVLKRFPDENVVLHLYPRPSDERLSVPPLPNVPPSFVGKTWSQIMHEDNLKVDQLVREFRVGRFKCYFNSEPVARYSKGKCKLVKTEKSDSAMPCMHATFEDIPQDLPFHDSDSDYQPFPSDTPPKLDCFKPERRTLHIASRCQIVKVSHGTQTSIVNHPVVKRKLVRKDNESYSPPTKVSVLEHEQTPEMKTSLCAVTLPESYSKIMSPLQPKAVVYVLSTRENAKISANVGRISRKKKRSQSLDCKGSIKYKYKMCPLKYYDPLTNKIMKVPPRGLRVSKSKSPHIRKLFRSLSPDINKEKLHRESSNSISVKGSDLCTASSLSPSSKALKLKIGDSSISQKVLTPSRSGSLSSVTQLPFSSDKSGDSFKQYVVSPLNQSSKTKSTKTLSPFIPKGSRTTHKQLIAKENPEKNVNKKRFKQKPSSTIKSLRMQQTCPSRKCEKGQRTCEKKMPRKNKKKEMPKKHLSCTNKMSSNLRCPKEKVGVVGKKNLVKKQVINSRTSRTRMQKTASSCVKDGQLATACCQKEKTSKIKKKCGRDCKSVERSSVRTKQKDCAHFIKDRCLQGSDPKMFLRSRKLTDSKDTKEKGKKAGTYCRPRKK
ncbi:DBF4-type zinc finger-containing protein 2 isoform X2 [Protopterus annectens]|nr:DBF4-type zinc finger-containing protein 2 isoform X2 [Protopterus annectens]